MGAGATLGTSKELRSPAARSSFSSFPSSLSSDYELRGLNVPKLNCMRMALTLVGNPY